VGNVKPLFDHYTQTTQHGALIKMFHCWQKLTFDIFEDKVSDYWWIIVSTVCLIMYGNMRLLYRWLEDLQRIQFSQSLETSYTINNEI
jgi:hypothetical protein